MSSRSDRPRTRPWLLAREVPRIARSAPVASVVTALIVGAVCAVIIATTGQTVQAEREVLARIDEAGTRAVAITDDSGAAALDPAAIDRIAGLSGVDWVVGFGFATDGRNAALGSAGSPVAVRTLYGRLPPTAIVSTSGRAALPGEGLVGPEAQATLGLAAGAGGVAVGAGAAVPVVGTLDVGDLLGFLDRGVLVTPAEGDPGPVRSIHLLTHRPEDVAAVADAAQLLTGAGDAQAVRIETSETLADVRAAVAGELGRFGRRLVTIVLGVGLVLVGLNVYGSITLRRRDFGRRRALGASRSVIAALVLGQTLLVAILGAAGGAAVGAGVVVRVAGAAPAASFVVAVAALAVLSAAAAALIPAGIAAHRDPITVLRVP